MKRTHSYDQQHKRTRYKDEESYFEDDEDDRRRYSSAYNNQTKLNNNTDEIDPLDAFMMNLEVQITKRANHIERAATTEKTRKT